MQVQSSDITEDETDEQKKNGSYLYQLTKGADLEVELHHVIGLGLDLKESYKTHLITFRKSSTK